MKIQIEIGTSSSHSTLLKKAAQKTLENLPKKVLKKLVQPKYTMHVSFGSDRTIRALNKTYRGKDKSTDVLSFSRLEGPEFPSPEPEIGDVIISLSIAKKQAKEYGVSLKEELSRLTVHGVLHLFGYDHEVSKKEERKMFRLQNKVLRHLGF